MSNLLSDIYHAGDSSLLKEVKKEFRIEERPKKRYKGMKSSDLIDVLEVYDNIIYTLVQTAKDPRFRGEQFEKKVRKLIEQLREAADY